MTTTIIDQAEREQALDPSQSYLVQAPAGSGKTGLLTQRFLCLLAQVTSPEEVIALTFTRKAANEMRERILQALLNAEHHPCPADDDHERTTWQLANTVLQQNTRAGWQLLDNPNRLQIMTLDALCAKLTRQMPLSTGLGGQTDIADNARALYHRAVRQLIMQTQPSCPWYSALKEVLLHLDNQAERLERLLVDMLACRDQWLPYLLFTSTHQDKRQRLEEGFCHIINDNLADIEQAIPHALLIELKELLSFAKQHSTEKNAYLYPYRLTDEPLTFDHDTWRFVAHWLLTRDDQWRKRVDKRAGFPSPASDAAQADHWRMMKQRMTQLLETLLDYPDLQQALIDCKQCPPARYTQPQWNIVDALITLLPLLCAALKLLFQQQHEVDFIEVAAEASDALGDLEAPSDLALRLDYKIQHLLVDEFQDTSIQQFHLLEQLTAGWQVDDGRTLFLVGDPMQSIYRFRAAQVGLFLKAKASGIGQLPLTFIRLSSNFRSQATLIEWFNQIFAQAFPAQQSIDVGAIAYSAAVATRPADTTGTAVTYHACRQAAQQAEQVVSLIQHHQRQPDISIAILVQSRTHLNAILPVLRRANIHYQAVDIDNLRERSVILDLWSLTQSLLLPYDHLAWLSLLRSPWCGLTLADLMLIANYHSESCLLNALQDEHCLERLSPDGARRVRYVTQVLTQALLQRQRQPLANWIKTTWRQLNGPTCLTQPEQWEEANTFFALLARFATAGDLTDIDAFEQELASLYAPPSRDAQVQIMTIHKAKGLEFDVVILPGLAQQPRADQSPLLRWAQRARSSGDSDLILAPIKASDAQSDPVNDYLKEQEKRKSEHEAIRLLYVAATRARRQLHLLAILDTDKEGEIKPPVKTSLLHPIWPSVAEAFSRTLPDDVMPAPVQSAKTEITGVIRRLPIDYFPHTTSQCSDTEPSKTAITTPSVLKFHAQQIGTLIHEQLLALAGQVVSVDDLPDLKSTWHARLRTLGILDEEMSEAIQAVEQALSTCLRDATGSWILSSEHEQARTEYALTGILDGAYRSIIIDRTFIDKHGVRWIIDYKTVERPSLPEDLPGFLRHQRRRHQPQLDNYARVIAQLGNHPIKCALYFPQFAGWIDWDYCKHSESG